MLDCTGAQIKGDREGKAIDGTDAKISGDVRMKKGDGESPKDFSAVGEVHLSGAEIGGDLNCKGGKFKCRGDSEDKRALSFTTARIKGGVWLNYGFESEGAVRFHDAEIGRNLDCSGGAFKNLNSRALDGTGAKIGSNVYFSLGFRSEGAVRMNRTETEGEFICSGGLFFNPRPRVVLEERGDDPRCENALKLRNAVIKNVLWLGRAAPNPVLEAQVPGIGTKLKEEKDALWLPAKFEGSLDLRDARTAVLIDDKQIWENWESWNKDAKRDKDPKKEGYKPPCYVLLDGFTYGRLGSSAPHDYAARKRWLECQPPKDLDDEFKPQPFRQLAKVLREVGHGSDARKIAIKEQDCLTKKARLNWRILYWLWRSALSLSFRYGYRPDFIVYAAAVVWAACAVVFYQAEQQNAFVPIQAPFFLNDKVKKCRPVETQASAGSTADEQRASAQPPEVMPRSFSTNAASGQVPERHLPKDAAKVTWEKDWQKGCLDKYAPEYPRFNYLVFSTDVLLPFVNLRQEEFWQPKPKDDFLWSGVRFVMYFEKLFGWFAAIMLGSILSGVIKRD